MPLPAAPKKRADALTPEAFQGTPRRSANKGDDYHSSKATSVDREDSPLSVSAPVADAQPTVAAVVPMTRRAAPAKAPAKTSTRPHLASSRTPQKPAQTKLFVLDTNVLLHDPSCLYQFKEHDIFLPMVVLEELDAHKKGQTDLARNARQMSRSLDELLASQAGNSGQGVRLSATGQKQAQGLLNFETELLDTTSDLGLPASKADNKILAVVKALGKKHPNREVILVSNDINMRIKSHALGLRAEDYANDKALDDTDLLYTGTQQLSPDFWDKHSARMKSWQDGGYTFYEIRGAIAQGLRVNQFVHLDPHDGTPFLGRVVGIHGNAATIKTVRDYGSNKNAVLGVTARNREQNFALNLLMDQEVDFVTLAGTAGSGKTLLALAAGLRQLEDHRYTEIIMTRVTVSVGEDIGFLPGNEEEKMSPWMGALDDNLEFLTTLKSGGGNGDWNRANNREAMREKIKIKSLNFMRGRTFLNKYVIIDEAQNLTPKQMKTLITRAGPGTKIVCMGNLAQIDTPYLTEGSSGFTFAVDRFKGWAHGGHITMLRGERSRLADFASEVL